MKAILVTQCSVKDYVMIGGEQKYEWSFHELTQIAPCKITEIKQLPLNYNIILCPKTETS